MPLISLRPRRFVPIRRLADGSRRGFSTKHQRAWMRYHLDLSKSGREQHGPCAFGVWDPEDSWVMHFLVRPAFYSEWMKPRHRNFVYFLDLVCGCVVFGKAIGLHQ